MDDDLLNTCDVMCSHASCNQCQSGTSLYSITCGHVFCRPCLEKFNLKKDEDGECPLCEEDFVAKDTICDDMLESLYFTTVCVKKILSGDGIEKPRSDDDPLDQVS